MRSSNANSPRAGTPRLQSVESYRIDRLLGTGGMSRVYLAHHRVTGQPAAIKLLHDNLASHDNTRRRFLNEARVISSIRHPHVVEMYETGETEDGGAYLVMEYVRGHTLEQVLADRGRLAVAEAFGVVGAIAEALATVHAHGVIHRDLKPSNAMLTPDGRVVVLDFGVAKFACGIGADKLTKTGAIIGTPRFMSPEQCRGDREIDHRADIYCLGLILFRALTGRDPFVASAVTDAIGQHLYVKPPSPRTYNPELTPAIERLILRCLEKHPEARHASMTELLAAMKAAFDQLPSDVATASAAPRERDDASTPPAEHDPQVTGTRDTVALPGREQVGKDASATDAQLACSITEPSAGRRSRKALWLVAAVLGCALALGHFLLRDRTAPGAVSPSVRNADSERFARDAHQAIDPAEVAPSRTPGARDRASVEARDRDRADPADRAARTDEPADERADQPAADSGPSPAADASETEQPAPRARSESRPDRRAAKRQARARDARRSSNGSADGSARRRDPRPDTADAVDTKPPRKSKPDAKTDDFEVHVF